MAKNNAAYDEFLADLKAINPQIEEILKDERVSTKLREGVLARADYSSHMDTLRQEKDRVNQYLSEERKKIDGWSNWYDGATREIATMQDRLKAYESEYGALDGTAKPRISAEDVNKQMAEEFQRREAAYMKFSNDLTDLKIEHKDRFKERLDTKAVFEISAEKQLPLDVAYEIYIADKKEALQRTEIEDRIKREREDAVKDYVTKHRLPALDSNPTYAGTHVVDAQSAGKTTEDRIKAAVEQFRTNQR